MLTYLQKLACCVCCLCCVGPASAITFSIPQDYQFTLKPEIPQTFTLNLGMPSNIRIATALDRLSVNSCCQAVSLLLCLKFMSSACSDFCESHATTQEAIKTECGDRARFKLAVATLFGTTGLALHYVPRMLQSLRKVKPSA